MTVTSTATPSAEATCRAMFTRAEPVPTWGGLQRGGARAHQRGQGETPTPIPVSSMLGSMSTA